MWALVQVAWNTKVIMRYNNWRTVIGSRTTDTSLLVYQNPMMNYFFWNIRGVFGDSKKGLIVTLIEKHCTKAMVLLEPMVANSKALSFAKSLGFDNVYTGDVNHSKIWCIWKGSLMVDIVDSQDQCIKLKLRGGNSEIYVTGVYAIYKRTERRRLSEQH